MPLTWFAHQTPVLPLKMARPAWFDATALCVGSMMPDVLNAFSAYIDGETHRFSTAMPLGLPLTLIIVVLTRYVVAPVSALQIPDFGTFRLHSYAVLSRRRPNPLITICSAALGIASHLFIDGFTHAEQFGAHWLGYDDVIVRMFGHDAYLATIFQYIGHTLGSAICVLFLAGIGRRRLLEEWYGADAVAAARAQLPTPQQRGVWLTAVAVGSLAGVAWALRAADWTESIQRLTLGAFAGGVFGSLLVRPPWRRAGAPGGAEKSVARV